MSVRRGSSERDTQILTEAGATRISHADPRQGNYHYETDLLQIEPPPGQIWELVSVRMSGTTRSRNGSGDELAQSQSCFAALTLDDTISDDLEESRPVRAGDNPKDWLHEYEHLLFDHFESEVPYETASILGSGVSGASWGNGPTRFEQFRTFPDSDRWEVEDTEEITLYVANDFPHKGQTVGGNEEDTNWYGSMQIEYVPRER